MGGNNEARFPDGFHHALDGRVGKDDDGVRFLGMAPDAAHRFVAECAVILQTEMNHGVHGGQTEEGRGFAKSRKAQGGLPQKVRAHQAREILYLLPSLRILCG